MQGKLGSATSACLGAWFFAFATCLACVGAQSDGAGRDMTDISGMDKMEYVEYRAGEGVPDLRFHTSGDDAAGREGWFVDDSNPVWATNAAGERISIERYCAIGNVEAGFEAASNFDAVYARCEPDLAIRLAKYYDETCGEWQLVDRQGNVLSGDGDDNVYHVWKVDDGVAFLLHENNSGFMRLRSFVFLFYDDQRVRTLICFECPPTKAQIECATAARRNHAALANAAAMIYNDDAESRAASDEYVEWVLKTVAPRVPAACRNLAFYYKQKGDAAASAVWAKLAGVVAERVKAGKFANEPRKPFALEKWPAHLGFAELSQCSDSPAK